MSSPDMVISEPTIEEFPNVLELEAYTKPPPAEEYSIKPGYWKLVLDRISKLESDRASVKLVLSDFSKQQLSVQHDFNMLDGKLSDLKTDSKASRF